MKEHAVKTRRLAELHAIRDWLPGDKTTIRQATDFAILLAHRAVKAQDLDGIIDETARTYTKRSTRT